jgi:hypothetical protein
MGINAALQKAATGYRHVQNTDYNNNFEVTGCEVDIDSYF